MSFFIVWANKQRIDYVYYCFILVKLSGCACLHLSLSGCGVNDLDVWVRLHGVLMQGAKPINNLIDMYMYPYGTTSSM